MGYGATVAAIMTLLVLAVSVVYLVISRPSRSQEYA